MTENLQGLENLTEAEQKAVLKILQELSANGTSSTLTKLEYSDFDEIPVDIHTFLHDRKYLGNALYDAEGRFTLFPYWEQMLEKVFPDNTKTAYNTIILTGAIGLGKAQPLDSLVLCENGFKKMGDLTLSDKVYGNDGNLHNILGIFPQGKKKICKVTFTDNTSTLCCDEHLWTVYNTKNQVWTTVETKQLLDGGRNLKHAKGHRYKIPMTKPIQFAEKPVVIDPYTFGVLLGDGCIRNNITFSSNDQEIIDTVKLNLLEGYEVRKLKGKINYSICKTNNTAEYNTQLGIPISTPNKYFEAIKSYNLNVTTFDKYIPNDYLYNSVENRIALLQGLMDTDGYISKDGSLIEFTTISEQLKDNFISLVQSLGGTCHVRVKHPSYKDKNENKVICNTSYNIGIKLPKEIKPFRLTRKLERLTNNALEPFRYIKDIEYVDDAECQCIYIDSKEHLYLTNDYIVTHNTLVAVVMLLYMLYRLLCLKDPYLYYGLQPIDKISISLMNITIENAKGVALDKMNQMILSSEWFMAHGEMAGITNLEYRPDKHIELIAASSNNQIIGRALFASFEDEVNFGAMTNNVEKLKAKMLTTISQVDARMKSRFLRGTYLPTLNIIASSKNSDQSFLDTYIETKKKNESITTLIVDEPQWVVDNRKDSDIHFYVAIGNKFLSNDLLPLNASQDLIDEYRAKGYTMLEVPIGYYENFQDNIDGALTDIAGIATASSLKYISGTRWNEIKSDEYQNPFTKEIIEVGNSKDDHTQYSDFFDLNKVPRNLIDRPMYIHLDMSMSGDKTGIAGIWAVGKSPKVEGESASKEMFYQLAFSVSVKAPKGYEISFDKHRTFIRWLKQQGFNIRGISCFKGDTLISTPDGLKAIKDIKSGDIVYAFDDITHSVVESKVYNSINNGPRTEFIKIWISDADYIECTPEHLIKTQRGYVVAQELLDDDLIEVDDKLFYKQKLLRTNLFIDNNYLDKYIELIVKNKNTSTNTYTEKHHILAKSAFNLLNQPIDNSDINICKLSYNDHILAHCLLAKCTIEPLKSKAICAVSAMLIHNKYLNQNTIDDYLNNTELQLLVKECKSGKKHTQEEIDKIKKSNQKPHNIHPKTEFKNGNIPWNKGISLNTTYSEEERKEKFSKNNDYVWITNGKLEAQIVKSEIIPNGYWYGRLKLSQDTKQKISITNKQKGIKPPVIKDYINYTDGISTIRVFPGDNIPEGFYQGRTMNTAKSREKNFLNSEKFKSINFEEYKEFYLHHSVKETIEKFEITVANHKKLCRFYNFTKYNYEVKKDVL